jgi:hypothetical protein
LAILAEAHHSSVVVDVASPGLPAAQGAMIGTDAVPPDEAAELVIYPEDVPCDLTRSIDAGR